MQHLIAFEQNVDQANVFGAIAAVGDPTVAVLANDIRVPNALPFIIGAAACINDASLVRAQLQSPSLRAMVNPDIEPLIQGKVYGSLPEQLIHPDSPIPVAPNEALNFAMQSDPVAGVVLNGLVWLADGPQAPIKGPMYSIRASSAVALAAGAWVNGALVFSQALPYGTYQVVGMRARGANLRAARLVFPGAAWRPGVSALNAIGNVDPFHFRWGNMGVFGQFDTTVPPTVDCLGDTDVAQTFIFDLMRIR